MIFYKSSQSSTNNARSAYNRISSVQKQESTSQLIDFIESHQLEEKIFINYIEAIKNFVKNGASIIYLNNGGILQYITGFYQEKINEYYENNTDQLKFPLESSIPIEPYLDLLQEISFSTDNECEECARQSGFHIFLQTIIQKSKQLNILAPVIKIIFNLVYGKQLTANLFDYEILMKNLYTRIYTDYFVLNLKSGDSILYTEEEKPFLVQKVAIPAFELVLVLLISNPSKMKELELYMYRLIVSVGQILENERSEKNEELYSYELNMILCQLEYILGNPNQEIVKRLTTINIVENIINSMKISHDISLKALKCLKSVALSFAGAFFIIRSKTFSEFRPNEDIDLIKAYCYVWSYAVRSLLGDFSPSKGRRQSAQLIIQQNAQSILQYLQENRNLTNDFEYQKVLSLVFITFANYKDTQTLTNVIDIEPKIIEQIYRLLEERNPEDLYVIIMALRNILDFFVKGGLKHSSIRQDISCYHQDIIDGLNEIYAYMENPNDNGFYNEIQLIEESIKRIYNQIKQ